MEGKKKSYRDSLNYIYHGTDWICVRFQIGSLFINVDAFEVKTGATARGSTVVRASVATETETAKKVKKESRKDEEGVITNVYKPKEPYVGRCLLNTKIVGDDAPGETMHMVFTTEGM